MFSLPPRSSSSYLHSTGRSEDIQRLTLEGVYDLSSHEKWWRDQFDILLARGYNLRPRYQPEWTPSWLGTDLMPECCEDSFPQILDSTLDAVRVSDGQRVCIKKVRVSGTHRGELPMAIHLSEPQMQSNPRSHCVSVLEYFPSTQDSYLLLVMPYLLPFYRPGFEFVDEVTDFMDQTLEGLTFLHDNQIAHGDLAKLNIMMDGEHLYPEGHHPLHPGMDQTLTQMSRHLRRRDVAKIHPVKYLFIDFQSTNYYDPIEKIYVRFGQDNDLPELHRQGLFSPFPCDIFTLGNVYSKEFLEHYSNLEFLEPLVSAMTRKNPDERITAAQALTMFRSLIGEQSWYARRWRLQRYGETHSERLRLDISSFIKEEILAEPQGWKRLVMVAMVVSSITSLFFIRSRSRTSGHIQALLRRSINS